MVWCIVDDAEAHYYAQWPDDNNPTQLELDFEGAARLRTPQWILDEISDEWARRLAIHQRLSALFQLQDIGY